MPSLFNPLGAGLDPRYERLDFPLILHWYEI